jgi:divalent metal cation (Fe/Co/Zn/Cd) transporter
VSFGADSGIEVASSLAAHWRLRADLDPERRERVERITHRIIGGSFLALAIYVTVESATTLCQREAPEAGPRRVGDSNSFRAHHALDRPCQPEGRTYTREPRLEADAVQTALCAYLSGIALAGVGLNTALGWWWADPVAALAMVPIIVKEGLEGVRGEATCNGHS